MNTNNTESKAHRLGRIATAEITMEASVSQSIIGVFRNTFPKVSNYLKTAISDFKATNITEVDFKKVLSSFTQAEKDIEDKSYTRWSNTPLACPEGFNSKYLPYFEFLNGPATKMLHEGDSVLDEYYVLLASFISNNESRVSNHDHTAFYARVDRTVTHIRDQLAGFFDPGKTAGLLPVYMLIDRMSDIKQIKRQAELLDNNRKITTSSSTLGKVQKISEVLDQIIKQSQTNEIADTSGNAVKSIAQGAMVVGHYVELLAILRYRMQEVITAAGHAADRIANGNPNSV